MEFDYHGIDLGTSALPREVELIRKAISVALMKDDARRPGHDVGSARTAIYAFVDYDGEPIYVGQTREGVRTRIGRHLTGQRSDAVAKYVLDPFEVHTIIVWSFPELDTLPVIELKVALNAREYAAYRHLLSGSRYQAVLNEATIQEHIRVELPEPFTAVIIPDDIFHERSHPDIRIARRAQTVALLAKNISERRVSPGLRRTLATQTERLNDLAHLRAQALGIGLSNTDTESGADVSDE
jgi:hypothetical protein